MRKSEVTLGGVYLAKISGKLTQVQILREINLPSYSNNYFRTNAKTNWQARNLATGRGVVIKSATKLRKRIR